MSGSGEYTVGRLQLGQVGAEITLPILELKFTEADLDLMREGRVASGKLVMDKIARKKIFSIDYEYIEGPDLENIIYLFDLNESLNFIITDRDESTRSYTVRFHPFSRRRWWTRDNWWWRDVTIVLEEF